MASTAYDVFAGAGGPWPTVERSRCWQQQR